MAKRELEDARPPNAATRWQNSKVTKRELVDQDLQMLLEDGEARR